MSGGITLSMFQTTAEFELAVPNPGKKQNIVKRFHYHKDKKLNPSAIAKIKNEDFVKNEKAKLPLFKKFLLDVQAYLKDNPQDVWFFEELTKDTQNNMNSIVRIVAPFVAYPVYGKIAIEEHSFPQIVMGRSGISAAVIGEVESLWPVIKASYMQMSLLEADDNKVTASGMKSSVPDVFYEKILPRIVNGELKNLPDGYVAFVRYAYAGVNLNNYKLLNGQTVAEFFGVDGIMDPETGLPDVKKQNDILIKQLTGEVAPKYGENIAKVKFSKNVDGHSNLSKAINKNRTMFSKPSRGMSTFDFDETLIDKGENFIIAKKDGEEIKISSGQWPLEGPRYAELGYEFDFTDFVNVRGGVDGPLLQKMKNQIKKFGSENVFVLTARPPQSATAIHEWLKTKGINIPFENITGLGDSTGEAKAMWMLEKFSEGYNDMYFVDDALPNVKAVKNVLDQLDIKSKVRQVRTMESAALNEDFNIILEQASGVGREKRFSKAKAELRGKRKGRFKFFIPASAEDFNGLLYAMLPKGKRGEKAYEFFKKNLLDPFARGINELNAAKQRIGDDYKALRRAMPDVRKKLSKKITGQKDFRYADAVRVYLWDKAGYTIPGLSEADRKNLIDTVIKDERLQSFADALGLISGRPEGYTEPQDHWLATNILGDLSDAVDKIGRKEFLADWIQNKNEIFTEENLNKLEAVYGPKYVEALKDILYRMENGTNRSEGTSRLVNAFQNWVNNSVGAIMFFNVKTKT